MKVVYDDEKRVIIVKIENIETVTVFNTTDIVEARDCFVKCMTDMFNDAICRKLKD